MKGDRVVPSEKLMELMRIKTLLRASPDIREDAVSELRDQILRKAYTIDAEKVSEKIMEHGICILNALAGDNCHPP